jgi:6-phosphofructokinase 1
MNNMEYLNLTEEQLKIDTLGKANISSPLNLSSVFGDNIANFIDDSETVILHHDKKEIIERIKKGSPLLAFERAGPREKVYFNPSKTKAGVVTCGGLCPGINNVIRAIVMQLFYCYKVPVTYGFRYGYRGFVHGDEQGSVLLMPEDVKDIHEKGGSILSSSRGHQDVNDIVDCLDRMGISILFTIGGDGTLQAAQEIYEEIKRRGLDISVIGVPKTIDNDICYVEKTFGLESAFSVAGEAIRSAHTEAEGAPYGIGLVKVMGRMSGFIAANAALAMNEVNFVLIPEVPFDLEGPNGFLKILEDRLKNRGHAVIIASEGAGQKYVMENAGRKDDSGNPVLGDIGIFLKTEIKKYFKENTDLYVNLKYIDPSYLVRAVPANAHDSSYCMRLAQNAVHAGMSGKTGLIVGIWNSHFTHVPLKLAVSGKKTLSPEDPLWLSVLEATGQPIRMVNG